MNGAALLLALQAAGVPCDGLRDGSDADRSTWTPTYPDGVTPTDAQRAAAAQVIASWSDPVPVSGDAIVGALSKAQAAACDVRDLVRIAWRDDVPATNAKLGRIVKAAGTTPDALRQAAQGT